MRRVILLALVTMGTLAVANSAQAQTALRSGLFAVSGQGQGQVLVAPTSADQGTFAVEVTINIHDVGPGVTFAVARAVGRNPDGICTMASGWLPLGDLTTSAGGAGAAHFEVHRGAPFVSGVHFDAVFRAIGSDGTVLLSSCLTVTVK
jgi:hypothetical protein